jgi:isocitrate dehydrogenase
MLVYIGQPQAAELIHNAWLRTLEDGVHTGDVYTEGLSKERVNTQGFTQAVIARLGQKPQNIPAVSYAQESKKIQIQIAPTVEAKKELFGVDIFLHHKDRNPNALGQAIQGFKTANLNLQMITNRGVKVYPQGNPATFCTDHWRCRYLAQHHVGYNEVLELMQQLHQAGFDIIKTENLCYFDGKPGFSLGQGQ